MVRRRGPTDEQLERLKALRLAAGLSLDTVAERTGLPVAHVQALESAQIDELPAGPYVGAYYRLVRGVLGGPEDEEVHEVPDEDGPSRLPVWGARLLALASVLLLLSLIGWQVANGGLAGAVDVAGGIVSGVGVDAPPSQVVVLTAAREARFRVVVDGVTKLDGRLPPGASRTFSGARRIEVRVQGAGDAGIQYNGRTIVPQGRQNVPRTLIFEDDENATP
ncbi:MAG: RodZ domain-containing protein [Myxococcota bacterium]